MNIEDKTDKQLRRMTVNHWKRMLKLSVDDIKLKEEAPVMGNCAFCIKYYNHHYCYGCPIYKKTGYLFCRKTPYDQAHRSYRNIVQDLSTDLVGFHKAVQVEIDFLELLEV